ncbi:MAG: hypothetical protein ABIO44_09800 [Saprospiraceae bacterium]
MNKLSPNDSLNVAMSLLETKREIELHELKERFHAVQESVRPINLIKDTFKALTVPPDLNNGISKTLIGVASAFLVKKVLFRNSYNPLKIITSIAVQTITSSLAIKNSDKIKSTGEKLFHALLWKVKEYRKEIREREMQS